MLIIHGQYQRPRVLGYVADYCAHCRDLKAFAYKEIRLVSHLYFIPLGRGKVQGQAITCTTCGTMFEAEASRYRNVLPSLMMASVEELAHATNPQALVEMAERLEREARMLAGELSAQDRMQIIVEQLLVGDLQVQARKAQVHFDLRSILILLALIVDGTAVLCVLLSNTTTSGFLSDVVTIAVVLVIILFGALVHSLATDPARFIRRKLREPLAKSLATLSPSLDELTAALLYLKQHKRTLGKELDPRWLYNATLANQASENMMGPAKVNPG